MKNTKQCPKCKSTNIVTNEGLSKQGERTTIRISSWHQLFLATYICTSCGYLEEYIEQEDLLSEKKMTVIKKNWKAL